MAESDLPFTTWLKRRRRSLDLTQAELAQQVAYSIFTIRKVETGELRPSKALAARLAEALEIPFNDRPAFVDFARGKPGTDQRLSPIPAPKLPANGSEPRARQNLPSPLTSFVGREAEVDAACALLARSDVRLLTLTGPGGVGKTRLALRVAALSLTAFPDGVCFCALGSLTDPGPVASAIANELGLVSSPHQSIVDSLKYYLRHKDQLLLLDCFEIVLDAAPLLSELLAAAPQLKLLVTSRILLRLSAEHNFSVAPFALPGRDDLAPDQLDASPAVRLFVERAAALRPGFMLDGTNGPIISQICRRLDGLPLAIELAAARLRVLSPQALLVRLEPRLPLLSEGPRDLPERQRTLHNTIAWSYKLLGEAEQRVFNWLAVFAGGGSVEATEYLGGAVSSHPADMVSILGRLADNSLVRLVAGPEDEPRFTILDTLREYGLEQLAASGEEPAIRGAHAEYYARLAEAGDAGLKGHAQIQWAQRLTADLDNIRAALTWAITAGAADPALRLGAALRLYWERHGDWGEGSRWLNRLVGLDGPAGVKARALLAAAMMQFKVGTTTASTLQESRTLARAAGDGVTEATALAMLGLVDAQRQGAAASMALLAEALALARSAGDPWTTAWILYWIGHAHLNAAGARAALMESVTLYAQCGDRLGQLQCLGDLACLDGMQASDEASYRAAISMQERSVAEYRELNVRLYLGGALNGLGEIARYHDDFARARRAYEDSIAVIRSVGIHPGIPMANLAVIALHEGDWERAAHLLAESWEPGPPYSVHGVHDVAHFILVVFAGVFAARKQPVVAATLLGAARAEVDRLEENLDPPDQRVYDTALATASQDLSTGTFLAAWEHGQAMGPGEAFAYGQAQLERS